MLKNIVEFIRVERLKQRMTMKDLSIASGVSEKQICTIENGKVNPSLETLEKLARPLGLVIDVHIKNKNSPNPAA